MFDDPKKELERLEEQLRTALEENTEETDWLEEARAMMDREFEGESTGNLDYDEDEDGEDEFSVPAPKKKKRLGGLIVVLVLELLGIAAVVLWWLQWLK